MPIYSVVAKHQLIIEPELNRGMIDMLGMSLPPNPSSASTGSVAIRMEAPGLGTNAVGYAIQTCTPINARNISMNTITVTASSSVFTSTGGFVSCVSRLPVA
jgi:hypothetical protein